MMNLKKLSTPELRKIRSRLDNFLYAAGVNIAFNRAVKQRTFISFLQDMRKTLLWQIEKIAEPARFDRLYEVSRLTKISINPSENQQIKQILDALFYELSMKVAFSENSNNTLSMFFRFGANAGGQAALDKMRIDGVFSVTNPDWLKFLERSENLLINSVDETTKKWIAGILQQGVENQLTTLEVRDLLITEGKGISKIRGEMIAQTELANTMNRTELQSYKKSGLTEKRYRTSRDERVCAWCGPLDGAIINMDKNFEMTAEGKTLTRLTPPIHVNCRCFMQGVENNIWIVGGKRVWMGD